MKRPVPAPPLPPPLPPGFTNKMMKLNAAAPRAMFVPASASFIGPVSTNWFYRANVTANHDGFAFWTPANTTFEADSALFLPPTWTPFAGWGPQTEGQYNGVLVPAARNGDFTAFYLRPRFTPSSGAALAGMRGRSQARKEVQWTLPSGRKVKVYLHNQ